MAPPAHTRLSRGPRLPYQLVAGVEPHATGWLVASGKLLGAQLYPEEPRIVATLQEILDASPEYAAVALHVPIGLPDEVTPDGRACERAARELLGCPRGHAVRSAPGSGQPADARVLEAAAELHSYHQRRVVETHPELAFHQLNGDVPLRYAPGTPRGRAERVALLLHRMDGAERILDAALPGVPPRLLVDACADLWTARRVVARAVRRVPELPEWNAQGLRMELVW